MNLSARIFLLFFFCFIAVETRVSAATFTVSNTADSGLGSLRQAVLDANAAASNDAIVFAPGIFNITVASSITITNNGTLDITGPGANVLTLTGTGVNIFFSSAATFTLRGVRLTGGSGGGAAVHTNGGTTVLEEIVVQNYNSGSLMSGAVYFGGGANHRIGYSTFSANTSTNECSAIRNDSDLTIVNTTVTGNTTIGGGGTGAVCAIGGTTTIRNSTIANNSSTGSGVYGGGGVFVFLAATANLGNTIVAGNTTNGFGPDVARIDSSATLTSAGGNFIGTNDGNPAAPNTSAFPTGNPNGNGDKVGTGLTPIDPMLGPLANNGGATPTRALLFGSPAIDAGLNANAAGLIYDQRVGFIRIQDGNGDMIANVDVGAFEFSFAPTAAPVSLSGRVMSGTGGIPMAVVSVTGADGIVRTAITNSFGYYRVDGLEVGTAYVVDTSSKRYTFASQVVNLRDDLGEFNIFAL
jgi:hypothetical protein